MSKPASFRRDAAIRLIIDKMTRKLVDTHRTDFDTVSDLAVQIEQVVFEYALSEAERRKDILRSWSDQRFVDLYVKTWRRIYLNLLIEENDLRDRIFIDRTVDVSQLPTMTNEDLYRGVDAEYWAERKHSEAVRQSQFEGSLELKSEGLIQCFKCLKYLGKDYSYNVEYVSVQTRSADEPMTNMCCCLRCGFRWRM